MTQNAALQDPAIADPREQGAKPEYLQGPIAAPAPKRS